MKIIFIIIFSNIESLEISHLLYFNFSNFRFKLKHFCFESKISNDKNWMTFVWFLSTLIIFILAVFINWTPFQLLNQSSNDKIFGLCSASLMIIRKYSYSSWKVYNSVIIYTFRNFMKLNYFKGTWMFIIEKGKFNIFFEILNMNKAK